MSLLSGAPDTILREDASSGVAALALLERVRVSVRVISCGETLPDMQVRSFFGRCAVLYPEAYRVLVLDSHGDVTSDECVERFGAQAAINAPLTSARVRELLDSAKASAFIRRESHTLRSDLARTQVEIDALRKERARLMRFMTNCVQRIDSAAQMTRWWDSVCRYVEAEVLLVVHC